MDNDGKEEIELELELDQIEYLENRAKSENKTVDQVIEDILLVAIKAFEKEK